jgi:hypothetical protein
LIVAIAAAGLLGCNDNDPTGPEPPAGEEFDWRGIIAQGDRIEIKNINGDVRASFTSGSEVVVLATKTGQESDPTSVTIEVVQHAEGVTICAVYPDVPGMEPNECLPGLPGNMSNGDNDVEVEFTVWVPAGVEFVGRVIGGDVEATGIQSDVFVVTMGGNVTVTTTGIAEVTSTFGSMNVAIGRADPERRRAGLDEHRNHRIRLSARGHWDHEVRHAGERRPESNPVNYERERQLARGTRRTTLTDVCRWAGRRRVAVGA